jgi:hypothetical protein
VQHNRGNTGPTRRNRRTRGHIIADLSANFVERSALLAGYSVERIQHDYGIDLLLFTYNEAGEIENASISLQLKATDTLPVLANQAHFQRLQGFDLESAGETVTVHIPKANRVTPEAMKRFADFKARVLDQARKEIQHGD